MTVVGEIGQIIVTCGELLQRMEKVLPMLGNNRFTSSTSPPSEHVFRFGHSPDQPCSKRPLSLTTPSPHRPPQPSHGHPGYPSTPT